MSAPENEKESRRAREKESKMKSVMTSVSGGESMMNTKRLPATTGGKDKGAKRVNAPRKAKYKMTKDEQISVSENCSDMQETTEYEDDTMAVTTLTDVPDTPLNGKMMLPATPPSNHFSPVTVKVSEKNWKRIRVLIEGKVNSFTNKNLVISKIQKELMTDFIPGDQIARINGKSIWNFDDLKNGIYSADEGSITVIRPWNIRCPTREQLENVTAERCQYFVVQCFGKVTGKLGMTLTARRNRILVNTIRAHSPVSSALLIGDQIIGVNDQLLTGNKKVMKKQAVSLINSNLKQYSYVDIFACRPVGARTSPVPSLEAEQVKQYPVFMEHRKKDDGVHLLFNVPLPSDSLEIALRELTFLQECGLPDSDDHSNYRGHSLIEYNKEDEYSAKSFMTSPISRTPLLSTLTSPFKTGDAEKHITFKDKGCETSNITSDIPEEETLKKCDGKAGMVAFIKARWNQKLPGNLPGK